MRQAKGFGILVTMTATLLFAAGPAYAAGPDTITASGASLTVVASQGLARPIDAQIYRGDPLAVGLAPGEAVGVVLAQQNARIRVLYAGRPLTVRNAILRDGRGYCLLVKRAARGFAAVVGGDGVADREETLGEPGRLVVKRAPRGIAVSLVSVGRADPYATQGRPDGRCVAKAER